MGEVVGIRAETSRIGAGFFPTVSVGADMGKSHTSVCPNCVTALASPLAEREVFRQIPRRGRGGNHLRSLKYPGYRHRLILRQLTTLLRLLFRCFPAYLLIPYQ